MALPNSTEKLCAVAFENGDYESETFSLQRCEEQLVLYGDV